MTEHKHRDLTAIRYDAELFQFKRFGLFVTPNAGLNAAFFNSPAASEPASRFQPASYVQVRRPNQPVKRGAVCGSTCLHSPLILLFQLSRKATNRCPVQNLGAASLPNLNRMRHQGFHKSINP
jgi:hypothetical protein